MDKQKEWTVNNNPVDVHTTIYADFEFKTEDDYDQIPDTEEDYNQNEDN